MSGGSAAAAGAHLAAAVAAALATLALAGGGCAPAAPARPARILSARPSGTVPAGDVSVELVFSAPVDARALAAEHLLGLCRREDLRAVALAAERQGGMSGAAPVVPATVEVDGDGLRAVLRPGAPLPEGVAWAAVLSGRARSAAGRPILDPEGKARTFALLFETGPAVDATPPRGRWILPPHGPVPANLAELRVGFDEPVAGTLGLDGVDAQPVPDERAGVLGLALAGRLAPGELRVRVDGVRDAAGNAAEGPPPLEVSRCATAAAPALLGSARAEALELGARLGAELGSMGRLAAEVSAQPGAPACGVAPEAASAVLRGEVAPCPGADPCSPGAARCPASLEVRPLCPGTEVRVRVAAEDLAGHRGPWSPWQAAAALPPRPRPVITEVLADADAPEAGGEYVELANVGTGPADLAGFALAKRTASGAFTRCALAPQGPELLAPGGYALVVGGAYDGRYRLPPEVPTFRCGAGALLGGLANDRPVALALEAPGGAVASSAGISEPAPRCAAGALERVHPAGGDAAANWACPGARSPGTCNASTPPAECPRRPW